MIKLDFNKLSMLIKMGREYGHRAIRDAGVTDTEHSICTFLYFHSEVSQDAVAKALMLDKTTVAKALLSLEKKGFLQRMPNPANRRENRLTVTETGREAISDNIGIYDDWLQSVLSCLTQEESRQFENIFDKLVASAHAARLEDLE